MQQSTDHLLMVEPLAFYANPQTMETNAYQVPDARVSQAALLERARGEFRAYRDMLVHHGVTVTTVLGHEDCPDMVFPNWFSVYPDGRMIIYPMLTPNRSAERRPRIIERLRRYYPDVYDWTGYEAQGMALESTASIVADHVNKRAYAGLSRRTSPALVEKWADFMGYDVLSFETRSHASIPVYHTDFMMYIGTNMVGICGDCIVDAGVRDRVLGRLRETHDVVNLSLTQLQANCGNALEVVGRGGARMLTMSQSALRALDQTQKDVISKHYQDIILPDLSTLESYGGGSARCMLMELF